MTVPAKRNKFVHRGDVGIFRDHLAAMGNPKDTIVKRLTLMQESFEGFQREVQSSIAAINTRLDDMETISTDIGKKVTDVRVLVDYQIKDFNHHTGMIMKHMSTSLPEERPEETKPVEAAIPCPPRHPGKKKIKQVAEEVEKRCQPKDTSDLESLMSIIDVCAIEACRTYMANPELHYLNWEDVSLSTKEAVLKLAVSVAIQQDSRLDFLERCTRFWPMYMVLQPKWSQKAKNHKYKLMRAETKKEAKKEAARKEAAVKKATTKALAHIKAMKQVARATNSR